MKEWYVYQKGNDPLGPLATDQIARSIFEGKIAADALVAVPGASSWQKAKEIPEVQASLRELTSSAARGPQLHDLGLQNPSRPPPPSGMEPEVSPNAPTLVQGVPRVGSPSQSPPAHATPATAPGAGTAPATAEKKPEDAKPEEKKPEEKKPEEKKWPGYGAKGVLMSLGVFAVFGLVAAGLLVYAASTKSWEEKPDKAVYKAAPSTSSSVKVPSAGSGSRR